MGVIRFSDKSIDRDGLRRRERYRRGSNAIVDRLFYRPVVSFASRLATKRTSSVGFPVPDRATVR